MLVRGVEDIHVVREQAALLRVAMLVARDEPLEALYAAVSEEVGTLLGAEAGAVMRFIGDERAVIVGVHRNGGVRGLPVNAELDFDRANSALGRAQSTLLPARRTYGKDSRGEFSKLMRSVDLRVTVATPIILHGEAWGALIASSSEEDALPAGSRAAARRARRPARPGADQRRRAAPSSPRRAAGSSRPATSCAAGSSASCTRARSSTSSRWRSSCGSRAGARSPAPTRRSCSPTCSSTRSRPAPS